MTYAVQGRCIGVFRRGLDNVRSAVSLYRSVLG